MKKILLIDDDENFLKLATIYLEEEEYEVVCARDGPEGLHMIKEENPDLVLLDILMPGMDGWEVQERIKKTSPETKVSFLTVVDSTPDLEGIGVSDYIVKQPFSKEKLVSRVRRILEG